MLNKESVGPFKAKLNRKKKDLQILGDLMTGVDSLIDKLGWTYDLEELVQKNIVLIFLLYELLKAIENNLTLFSKI